MSLCFYLCFAYNVCISHLCICILSLCFDIWFLRYGSANIYVIFICLAVLVTTLSVFIFWFLYDLQLWLLSPCFMTAPCIQYPPSSFWIVTVVFRYKYMLFNSILVLNYLLLHLKYYSNLCYDYKNHGTLLIHGRIPCIGLFEQYCCRAWRSWPYGSGSCLQVS